MNEAEVVRELGKVWMEDKDNYVLVKNNGVFLGYTIMNTLYNTMLIIEVDEIARYVVKKMLEHGVRVVDDFETVKNHNRPDPIFLSPEHEEQYRLLQQRKKEKN